MHGSVRQLAQLNSASGQQMERHIRYRYDLVSGNVNYVEYEPGREGQFLHRYTYDADNRIVRVETSRDGYVWDTDARYQYYAHGPLARAELGHYRVQSLDYAYTLQGWIKGVNLGGGGNEGLASKDAPWATTRAIMSPLPPPSVPRP